MAMVRMLIKKDLRSARRSASKRFRRFIGENIVGAKPRGRARLQTFLSPGGMDARFLEVAVDETLLGRGKLGHRQVALERIGAGERSPADRHVRVLLEADGEILDRLAEVRLLLGRDQRLA